MRGKRRDSGPAGLGMALFRALVPAVVLIAGLSAGFSLIYHQHLLRALYSTLVTMTTLGDPVLTPHTPLQEAWTAFSAVAGVAGGIAAVAGLATFDWSGFLQAANLERRLRGMERHVVVAGGGRVGRRAAIEAQHAGRSCIVLEQDERAVQELEAAGILCLHGDAREPELLQRAGLERASGLIAALPDDAANLYIVMFALELNPSLRVAARAGDTRAAEMLRRTGAQRVVMPEVSAGRHLAQALTSPTFLELIDDGSVREAVVARGTHAAGHTLKELSGAGFAGIVAAVRRNGDFLGEVAGDTRLEVGDTLLLVGDSELLQRDLHMVVG